MIEPVISVKHLSKQYLLEHQHQDVFAIAKHRLKNLAKRAIYGKVASEPAKDKFFWALKDINFDIYQGERVGIIGQNGAGKSTLLKILSRLVYPTTGEAIIRGRVTSLLEVGTGFNNNLSGRENIYLNASLHGLSRPEVDQIFQDIVNFSGVGTFLDTPVKHYSSGMRVRLAFSVAAHLDPDILLLDEVLAVGDIAFQKKCLQRVEGLTSSGRTILFVSHSIGHIIQFCDRVIWLDHGEIRFDGAATDGVQLYQEEQLPYQDIAVKLAQRSDRTGTGIVQFTDIEILDAQRQPIKSVATGQDIYFALKYKCLTPLSSPTFDVYACIRVETEHKQRLFGLPSEILPIDLTQLEASGTFLCKVPRLPLIPGIYGITISLLVNRQLVDKVSEAYNLLVVEGDYYGTGKLPLKSYGQLCVDFDWIHISE
ncbi:ABC transporter ATP-binding protein [filamentous cyanobacterium CCP5]|nr:ABC transporter ATP-binding protein [filamentous cyanobacterium CCP5]